MPIQSVEEAFQVLGIAHGSSEEEVKRAYKKLALRTHPDKNPDDPEAHKKFLLISEAYKRITDPDSFRDEDDAEPTEEEMEAMFNMMFAEMMGVQGFQCGGVPFEMFEMLDAMMGGDDFDNHYDDEEDDMDLFNHAAQFFGAAGMGGMPWDGDHFRDPEDNYLRSGSLHNQLESLLLAEMMEAEGRHRGSKKTKAKTKKATPAAKSNGSKPAAATTSAASKGATDKRAPHDGRSDIRAQPTAAKAKGAKDNGVEEGDEDDDDEEWESASSDENEPVAVSGQGKHVYRGAKNQSSRQREQELDDEDLLACMMNEMNMNFGRGGGGGGMSERQMMDLMLGMVMDAGMFEGDSEEDSEEDDDLYYHRRGQQGGRGYGAGAGRGSRGPTKGKAGPRVAAQGGGKPTAAESHSPNHASKNRQKPSAKGRKDGPETAAGAFSTTASAPNLPTASAGTSSVPAPSSRNGSQQATGKPASTPRVSQTGKRSTQGTEASTEEIFEEPATGPSPARDATNQPLAVGDRVKVNNRHAGTVAYVGSVHYARGAYVGVIMDEAAVGKNNGTLKGVTYFRCPADKKALVVTVSEVTRM